MPHDQIEFPDKSTLEFDTGHFDNWCVYYKEPGGQRHAPHDTEYFATMATLANTYGTTKVYQDFVSVYNKTGSDVSSDTLQHIKMISSTYNSAEDQLTVLKTLSILYYAMIAEQNKQNTQLGKRIKRLGIHRLLMENIPVKEAATCMIGLKADVIARECCARGL